MRTFLLTGCNNKAMVGEDSPDYACLTSYETKVAWVIDGSPFRAIGQPQSNTTAKHMREFFAFYGFPRMTKAELLELPIR